MSSWRGPAVSSCIQGGLALSPAAPWWDQSVLWDDFVSPTLGNSGNLVGDSDVTQQSLQGRMDRSTTFTQFHTPLILELPHHNFSITLIYVSLPGQ